MKNARKFLGMVALGALLFTGCRQEDATVVVQENEVPNGTETFTLSVQVIPSSEETSARTTGLQGATVTINQNGAIQTKTANDASGIVTFEGLFEGQVSIFVSADGYLSFNTEESWTREFNSSTDEFNDVAQVNLERIPIILPRRGATISGYMLGDTDNDGIDEKLSTGQVRFELSNTNYQPNVFTTTPSNGLYTLSNMPEAAGTISTVFQESGNFRFFSTSTGTDSVAVINEVTTTSNTFTPTIGKTSVVNVTNSTINNQPSSSNFSVLN